jgi:hypothetical protein
MENLGILQALNQCFRVSSCGIRACLSAFTANTAYFQTFAPFLPIRETPSANLSQSCGKLEFRDRNQYIPPYARPLGVLLVDPSVHQWLSLVGSRAQGYASRG